MFKRNIDYGADRHNKTAATQDQDENNSTMHNLDELEAMAINVLDDLK
jgi:hypothetical protein